MENNGGKFRKTRKNFAQVSNYALQDPNLSLGAKGLYALIESYITIPDFVLYKQTLMNVCKEGRDGFHTLWNQLKNAGYLIQYKLTDKEGHFYYEYELLENPIKDTTYGNSVDGKAGDGETTSGKSVDINNTQSNKTKKNNINKNNNSVVDNKNTKTSFDEELFKEKIEIDKFRFVEVGILKEDVANDYENKIINLFKTFSLDEQENINKLSSSKAFEIYFNYIKAYHDDDDVEENNLSVKNPEGYVRNSLKNITCQSGYY